MATLTPPATLIPRSSEANKPERAAIPSASNKLPVATVENGLERTSAGLPIAYERGRLTFMGVELLTAPGALVPRTETELLGRTALGLLVGQSPQGTGLNMIDMCCGSGNLACGIARSVGRLRVYAADLTDGCVSLAQRNVDQLGLRRRVSVHQGDLFGALADHALAARIDMVVCNPPYISTGRLDGERADLLRHEPREAFDAGPYGLAIHQRLIREATTVLRPGGWLLCEIGHGQQRQVGRLFGRVGAYETVEFVNDSTGEPRVAMARVARLAEGAPAELAA